MGGITIRMRSTPQQVAGSGGGGSIADRLKKGLGMGLKKPGQGGTGKLNLPQKNSGVVDKEQLK